MNNKKVLIIIRGAKPLDHFKSNLLENSKKLILKKLSTKKGFVKENYLKLAKYLSKYYDKVLLLKWDGDIIKNPSLSIPIQELKQLLKKLKNVDIDIIAVSLGGYILEKALQKKRLNKINKILYIGAVHNSKQLIGGANKIINVYSTSDNMFFFSNSIVEGFGNFVLKGKNVINIALDNLTHDSLLQNKRIKQYGLKEKSLYELYKNLLTKS